MENIEYDNYVKDTLRLVRTLVVKIEALAIRDNRVLEEAGYPVSTDKRTWRYYMNLNGDYHPTDEPMWVNSVETGEDILFNKANMAFYIATFREYQKGGYWFNRLVDKYQGQSELIKGILNPLPYEVTIPAPNYKILGYNKDLVLWNEGNLIPRLETFINGYVPQLYNHEYIYTDNLVLPVLGIMQLWNSIIMDIGSQRFEAIGSRNAHDFYIWARIDSYGDFSKYKASLSNEQTMWLYKNIAWLKMNPGAQYTFNLIMDNLLTPAGIPLASYDLVQNTATQIEDLTPTPLYRKLQLNLKEVYGLEPSYVDTRAMIEKERGLAKDNYDHTAQWYEDALRKGTHSLFSELPTKVLESKMMDYTNRHLNTKMSVTFNNWIYLAGKGYYRGRILVKDPKTGKDVRLSVGDAYYLWRYLTDLSRGQERDDIEPAYYQNVMKAVPPTLEELIDIGGKDWIPLYMAFDIRALWVPPQIFVAPDFLMSHSEEIYGVMWKHTKIYSQFRDLNKFARVKNTTDLMYETGFIELTDLTTYQALLARYELDVSDHSPEEAQYFAWEIFKRVTGWDTSSNPSLRVIQSSLIDIMMSLSSYTIQTIKEMDDGLDVSELPNEIFVGNPALVGKGNHSDGNFQFVGIQVPTNLDTENAVSSLTLIPQVEEGVMLSTSDNFARIIDNSTIVPVDLYKDLEYYAVRVQDTSYIAVLHGPEATLPPTDYGRLEWQAE